eukprot:g21751.t1
MSDKKEESEAEAAASEKEEQAKKEAASEKEDASKEDEGEKEVEDGDKGEDEEKEEEGAKAEEEEDAKEEEEEKGGKSGDAKKAGKKSAGQKRKAPATADSAAASRTSGRSRKQAKFFAPDEGKTREEVEYTGGEGTKLGDHPNVARNLNMVKPTDELLEKLHRILYDKAGKKQTRKKTIKDFSGFSDTNEAFATKKKAAMSSQNVSLLQNMAKLLDARGAASGSKEEVVDKLYEFLVKPEPSSGEGLQPSKKSGGSKKSGKGKKSGTKKDGGPKTPNPYMNFAKFIRPTIMEESPDMKMTDVSKEIGKRWNALSDKEKAKYKEAAASSSSKSSSKPAKKKQKKDIVEDDTEDESEDEDLGLEPKLRAKIKEILKEREGQDQISSKEVRKTLKQTFGDVIDEKKDWVKGLIRSEYEKSE